MVYYGNSGHGVEVMIKGNGTGWWNDVELLATPECVLCKNVSMDNTFEVRSENNVSLLYVYVTGGEYRGKGCTSQTDKILSSEYIYPRFPPFKYYFKIASVDDDRNQQVLVLSQEDDEEKRFVAGHDTTLTVLKKL